jgi:hypothetical protein
MQLRAPSPLPELQAAVIARLTAALAGVATVHFEAPPNTPYPYVTLNQWSLTGSGTKTSVARPATATINVWSSAVESFEEVSTIHNLILSDLTSAPLTLTGWRTALYGDESSELFPQETDDGGVIQRAVIRFIWLLQKTA